MHFSHDLSFYKLGNFFLDGFVLERCLSSSFLPYSWAPFTDIQAVFCYESWNACHVCRLPNKYVKVVPKQITEFYLSFSNRLSPIVTVCSGYSGWIATFISFATVGLLGRDSLGASTTILHSGITVLMRSVTVPPSTKNLSISRAMDGTAWIFLRPRRSMIPLYDDGDLTTIKFINAIVECSPSPKDTIRDICTNGQDISPLNPKSGVVAGERLLYNLIAIYGSGGSLPIYTLAELIIVELNMGHHVGMVHRSIFAAVWKILRCVPFSFNFSLTFNGTSDIASDEISYLLLYAIGSSIDLLVLALLLSFACLRRETFSFGHMTLTLKVRFLLASVSFDVSFHRSDHGMGVPFTGKGYSWSQTFEILVVASQWPTYVGVQAWARYIRAWESGWLTIRHQGNTRDLGSFGEETNEITDPHQILEEVLLTEREDGFAGIKQRHRDPSSDGVRDLLMTSGCS
nr:hypothetical protein [Tanacetum cinerariifolium]